MSLLLLFSYYLSYEVYIIANYNLCQQYSIVFCKIVPR
nr:MAG TPA: hypothetical protein [Caudoviricetes sp.]